jgi:methylated-DNA-[protein]-cysteine S-methyltransferase
MPADVRYARLATPVGPILVAETDGAVVAIHFEDGRRRRPADAGLAVGMRRRRPANAGLAVGMRRRRPANAGLAVGMRRRRRFDPAWRLVDAREIRVAAQLAEYFAGTRRTFEVRLAPQGTPFQRRVWEAVAAIPYGKTRSYGAIAAEIGAPSAVRAVGAANGQNPWPIVVPCHRVIGSDGSLTGYGGGLPIKRALLDFERGAGRLFDDGGRWVTSPRDARASPPSRTSPRDARASPPSRTSPRDARASGSTTPRRAVS